MAAIDQSVGQRVRLARERAGLTQERLAHKLGVDTTAISRYESAERVFGLAMLERVAAALGVTVGWLLADRIGEPGGALAKLRPDEEELLMVYRTLSPNQREVARWLVGDLRRVKLTGIDRPRARSAAAGDGSEGQASESRRGEPKESRGR